jgi:N-acetylmuramic acid 6-phosphate (MurNAc-6-P) etherase
VEWSNDEIRALVEPEKFERTLEIVSKIKANELMRYKIGSNGIKYRSLVFKDSAIAVMATRDTEAAREFQFKQLATAQVNKAHTGLIFFGSAMPRDIMAAAELQVLVSVPETDLLLDGVTRVAAKLVMNAVSTCTMVRLGRVMGNYMVWVVPSNLKLIDRATRYITKLTDLNYEAANALLFEIIEYVEPRMKADQAYPPVVGMAVLRAKNNLTNEQAEAQLQPSRA